MTVNADADPATVAPSDATFKIKERKLYVPVVTLSKENVIKLLEQLKTGFERTIKLNKCRSRITVPSQNNNLNYLIDPTFINVNRLFVLSFARNRGGDNTESFLRYYVPNVRIKDLNILIDGKSFFFLPKKKKKMKKKLTKKLSK